MGHEADVVVITTVMSFATQSIEQTRPSETTSIPAGSNTGEGEATTRVQ
jgi:hypothetical protein